jgi:hypothetical protein
LGSPLKGPSKALKRRLAALQEKQRLKRDYKPFDEAGAVDLLRWFLDCHVAVKSGKACPVPQPPMTDAERAELYANPHFAAAMRQSDAMHDRLMAAERERQQAKRQAKLARRAARRAAAAALPANHGPPTQVAPQPAVAAPAPIAEAEPVQPRPLNELRY